MKKLRFRLFGKLSEEDRICGEISPLFDKAYYLNMNPDVRAEGLDPVRHYIRHGHHEGRNPSADFSTRAYLARYPDVVAAGMNAFLHYVRHGRFENRVADIESGDLGAVDETVLVSGTANTAADPFSRRALSERLPLDYNKASRLLGVDASTMMPRPWRVGMTRILEPHTEGEMDTVERLQPSDGEVPDGDVLAQQMLAAAEGKVLSLDLWDTILRRHCAPDAIKLRHARAQWLTMIDSEGSNADLHPVDLFQLRRMAEADAADEHFEYRMSDIADRLAPIFGLPNGASGESFLGQELHIEKAAVSVDEVIGQVIAKHEGRKIVVSDFYMPGQSLNELLRQAGVDRIEAIYSSSDHMATKRAGELYDLILDKEGLGAGEILHIGDRFGADVVAARQRGIAAFHYHSPSHQPRLERLDRDFWAHINGDETAHAKRLASHLGHQNGVDPSLEMLSVPATGFVLHIMEQALRRKVDKVFFFTREGVFFRRIYQLLVERDVFDLGTYPQSVLLEVSRNATFAASMDDFTVEELMRLWSQYSEQSVAALATTLNIDVEVWAGIAGKLGLELDEPVHMPWRDPRFLAFLKHPRVAHIAREAIWSQRAALLEYLEASGFEPRADKARVIVDIGWRGTIQDNLARVVRGNLHGCYFGLERFLNQQAVNVSKSGYVFDVNRRYPLQVPEVAGFEFLFNAAGGSAVAYNGGKALRQIVPDEEVIITGPVARMQERLLAASKKVTEYVRCHGLISADLVSFAREIAAEFAQSPPSEVAEAFFQLSHNESFGVGSVHSMRFDANSLDKLTKLNGSRLHGEVSSRLKGLRWRTSVTRLSAFQKFERKLSPSQELHLPTAPGIVRSNSLGRPRIAVLSPVPIRGSGGHRTIFNFAAALSRRGYDVHLMHEQPPDHATQEWIGSVLGNVSLAQHPNWLSHLTPAASVATIWYSAEYAAQFWPEAKNFYFVQDYEAMFNPMGDVYLRAAQSYSLGARHICVGRWLAHNLRTQFGVGVASGGLGVDHQVYRPLPEVERHEKQIALLFQPEKFRRAPELCAAALAIVKSKMPTAQIVLYGSDHRPNLPFEYDHLGLIADVNRINDLYNESAVGLCISSTNPSRIPFEMMAAGCVPVDVYRYNNLFDYDAGTGLLAHEASESIAEALLRLLGNSTYRNERSRKAIESVRHRSLEWEMDVAVNAVAMGMAGFDFDELDCVTPTYTDPPVIAKKWDTDPVNSFMSHQWAQAETMIASVPRRSQARTDVAGRRP
jgi:FMN phosphatase YigB (HAD superfamily)